MLRNFMLIVSMLSMFYTLSPYGVSKSVEGDYVADLRVVDIIDESDISVFEDLGIDMSDLTIDVNLDLDEAGLFVLSVDAKSFVYDFSELVEENIDEIIDLALADAGFSRDQITDEVAQSAGYANADELFTDFADKIMAEVEPVDSEIEEAFKDATVSGTYEVSRNTIIFDVVSEDAFFQQGTINPDGTISIFVDDGAISTTLVFSKQEY